MTFICTSKTLQMFGLTSCGGKYEEETHTGKITTAVSLAQVSIMNTHSHFMMSDDYVFLWSLLFIILDGCTLYNRTLLLGKQQFF